MHASAGSVVGGKDQGPKPTLEPSRAPSKKVNDGLVRLDLSYNEISSRGVLVIAQALEDNDRLEVLRLDGNRYACARVFFFREKIPC